MQTPTSVTLTVRCPMATRQLVEILAEQEQKARSAVAAELLLEGTLRRLSSTLSVGGKERAEPIPA